MPVIGTPITAPPSDGSSCDVQGLSLAQVTQLYGIELPTKRRAAAVNSGTKARVRLQLFDNTGNPVDLTNCAGEQGEVEVRIREVFKTRRTDIFSVNGTVTDAADGLISFTTPTTVANNPGVYNCELGVTDGAGDLIFTNQFYLWVNRGLFGDPQYPNAGPPTIDEVRLFMRDNAPEENRLLDDFEFDLAEICHATELAVRFWNEAQPPIGIYFNTCNYAVRHKWLQCIAGHMFQVAAHRFRRNHLPYQAGGISIDDQNKFQQYDQIGMMLTQEYKEWVKQKKVAINCMLAMTSSGSAYGATAYTMLNSGV